MVINILIIFAIGAAIGIIVGRFKKRKNIEPKSMLEPKKSRKKLFIVIGLIIVSLFLIIKISGIGIYDIRVFDEFDFKEGYWWSGRVKFFGIYRYSSGFFGFGSYENRKEWYVFEKDVEILSSTCEIVLNEADPAYSKSKSESKYSISCLMKNGRNVGLCCRDKYLKEYKYELPTKENPRIKIGP